MSQESNLPGWFANAIEAPHLGNTDGWMAIYEPDVVHEFPFAPAGAPRRLVGRDAIAVYMRQFSELIRFGSLSDVRVREVAGELIIEATGHHSASRTTRQWISVTCGSLPCLKGDRAQALM